MSEGSVVARGSKGKRKRQKISKPLKIKFEYPKDSDESSLTSQDVVPKPKRVCSRRNFGPLSKKLEKLKRASSNWETDTLRSLPETFPLSRRSSTASDDPIVDLLPSESNGNESNISNGMQCLVPIKLEEEDCLALPCSSTGRMDTATRTTRDRKQSLIKRRRNPYKHARLYLKKSSVKNSKISVKDMNSSDEDSSEGMGSRMFRAELASLFFQELSHSQENKTLFYKLHKSIFRNGFSDSESDFDAEQSDTEGDRATFTSNKGHIYEAVDCPGHSKFEAFVGPGDKSKLSILKTGEIKTVINSPYEIYKVNVSSVAYETDTNIMVPIPEDYDFGASSQAKPEKVPFSHVPHTDPSSLNFAPPEVLEKMAQTHLKLRKCKDEIKVLRQMYIELFLEYANRPQFSTLSDLVGAAAKFLSEDQLVFFMMQLKAGSTNTAGIRYSVRERILALSIYQKSPEMYNWFSKLFSLPSKKILDQWLEDIGTQDPKMLKKLMYHIYTTYNFSPSS